MNTGTQVPIEENKTTEVKTEENKAVELNTQGAASAQPVQLQPTVNQEQYAKFQAWEKEQAEATRKEELLAPLGGVDGYNKAIDTIRQSGNMDFLKQIDADLGKADTQAIGIAKIKAFTEAAGFMKPVETKKEAPMFNSVLPAMGASDATANAQAASNPKVNVSDRLSFEGIKDPAVVAAMKEMGDVMNKYNRENPNNYKGQHLVGLKAMNETLGEVVKQAETFGDYDRAEEALSVVSQLYSQLAKQGVINNDKSLVDIFNNAKEIVYQADGIETTIQSDRNAKLSYKDSMFGRFGVK